MACARRIKLAAVVYRPPPLHLLRSAPYTPVLLSGAAPAPPPPPQTLYKSLSPCHTHSRTQTQFWIVALSTSSHDDTIYSVQPLLPRVLWLSSMQISHVLIVVIYLFIFMAKREGKKRGGVEFPPLIRWLSRGEKNEASGQAACISETTSLSLESLL